MSHRIYRLFGSAVLTLLLALVSFAQTASDGQSTAAGSPELSITIGEEHVRFTPLKAVQEVRLQIFSQADDLVLDSGPLYASEFQWNLRDGNDNPLAPGLYNYTFSIKAIDANTPTKHTGHFIVEQSKGQFWLMTKGSGEAGAEVVGGELIIARDGGRTITGARTNERKAAGSAEGRTLAEGRQKAAQTTSGATEAAAAAVDGSGSPHKIAKWVSTNTLGDSILHQGNGYVSVDGHFALKENMLKLRAAGDTNNVIIYNAGVDGPEFRANKGFRWANVQGGVNERMRLTEQGNLSVAGTVSGGGNVALNDNMLRLRGLADPNHGMLWSLAVDGPEFRAFSGFRWTRNLGNTELMRLDGSGRLSLSNGVIQRGSGPISTSDLGLYSLTAGAWLRLVTNNAPIQFFTDSFAGGSLASTGNDAAMTIAANRNVGIGIGAPATKLHVNGTVRASVVEITGGSDVAEPYHIAPTGQVQPKPGMLVAINPGQVGQMRVAARAYDKTVSGIISGANGIQPGITLRQEGTVADGTLPVASVGRVWAWCDADAGGPIKPGDLLTTSNTPGHAMKVTNHRRADGAVIGKAMSSLKRGKGLVLVLVSLK